MKFESRNFEYINFKSIQIDTFDETNKNSSKINKLQFVFFGKFQEKAKIW